MRRKLLFVAGIVLVVGVFAGSVAVARPQTPAFISVEGYMADQACQGGDNVPTTLTAKARSSSRPVMYRWDFTNNGSFDTLPNRNPRVMTTYADEVNVTALVEATNPDGDVATDTVTFGTLRCP